MSQREPVGHDETEPRRTSPRQQASEVTRLRAAVVAAPDPHRRDFLRRIPLRSNGDLLLIPASRIVMIVAKRPRLVLTTVDQREHSLLYPLKDLEERLDPFEFLRLGRSVIVNLNAVSRIASGPGGTNRVFLEGGQEATMSRKQSLRLRRVLLELLG
jgi:DNA-binding LytR/AlgR family response regulator